ncbi:hypothetical protein WH47_10947 [Habropoda laboriosa]|uniref:Uncharacterized protein n=1 Tax=Habropoda laboriosa TaxID=597456 RepID=A0A0L7R9E1_9HYME|nr:hypothetical protein WH47_10947 [Habropoda laboriosa]
MAIVGAVSEMSATRFSVWFGAVLFVTTTLVHSQITWTPIYLGQFSEYLFFAFDLSNRLHQDTWPLWKLKRTDGISFFLFSSD